MMWQTYRNRWEVDPWRLTEDNTARSRHKPSGGAPPYPRQVSVLSFASADRPALHFGTQMAPGQPRYAVSVGAETWRRIEVVTRDENLGGGRAGEVDADERGDRLPCAGVILPDADHAPPAPV